MFQVQNVKILNLGDWLIAFFFCLIFVKIGNLKILAIVGAWNVKRTLSFFAFQGFFTVKIVFWWQNMCLCYKWWLVSTFSHILCRQKTILLFVFRKNCTKSVLMKLCYLMIMCGKIKPYTYFLHGDQLPLALQVSLGIICVFCILAHVLSSKSHFALHF